MNKYKAKQHMKVKHNSTNLDESRCTIGFFKIHTEENQSNNNINKPNETQFVDNTTSDLVDTLKTIPCDQCNNDSPHLH